MPTHADAIEFHRALLLQELPPEAAEDFEYWLQLEYQRIRAENTDQEDRGEQGQRLTAFLLAVGLLTYGHLEVIDDLIHKDLYLPREAHMSRLIRVLRVMLPLPEQLDPLTNRDEVREWVLANRARLSWDESEQRFKFLY